MLGMMIVGGCLLLVVTMVPGMAGACLCVLGAVLVCSSLYVGRDTFNP